MSIGLFVKISASDRAVEQGSSAYQYAKAGKKIVGHSAECVFGADGVLEGCFYVRPAKPKKST